LFSYNSRHGWCESCYGTGVEMPGFDDEQSGEELWWNEWYAVAPPRCGACDGQRLNSTALNVRFRDRSIAALSAGSVAATGEFFARLRPGPREREIARDLLGEIRARLKFLERVGLGYLELDRGAPTLSGGGARARPGDRGWRARRRAHRGGDRGRSHEKPALDHRTVPPPAAAASREAASRRGCRHAAPDARTGGAAQHQGKRRTHPARTSGRDYRRIGFGQVHRGARRPVREPEAAAREADCRAPTAAARCRRAAHRLCGRARARARRPAARGGSDTDRQDPALLSRDLHRLLGRHP